MTRAIPTIEVEIGGITAHYVVRGEAPIGDDGIQWVVTGFTGWGGAPVRTASAARAAGHGAYRSRSYADARPISLEITATVLDPTNPMAPQPWRLPALQRRVAALCPPGEELYPLTITDPHFGVLSADVERVDEVLIDYFRDGLEYSLAFTLPLRAPDPRLYGPWITAETQLPDGGTGGMNMSDPGANLGGVADPGGDLGTGSVGGTATLATEGSADVGVVLEILGPAPEPEVRCPELGAQISYAGTVEAGQRLYVNTGDFAALDVPARATSLLGESRDHLLTVFGGWPEPGPGVTHWEFTAGAYSDAARLFVHARSGWW